MVKCPTCGSENAAENSKCSGCGGLLRQEENLLAGIVCPDCDTFNSPESARCVRCGKPLTGNGEGIPLHPEETPSLEETTQVEPRPSLPPREPEPPGRRPTDSMPAAVAVPKAVSRCPFCKSLLPAGTLTCPVCTRPVTAMPGESMRQTADELSVRLRLCRGFGREDATYPVGPAGVTIGRSEATIQITDDPYLAPLHAAVIPRGGKLWLEDRSSRNGTYLRVRGKAALTQGAELILGHQRLSILGFGGPTTDPRLRGATEVRILGGPPTRHLFIALRSLHANPAGEALAGPVILRSGPVVTIGTSGCHINFPGDSRLSSHHAEIHLRPAGTELVVSGHTGAFLRVRGATPLQNGDEIMLGEEVLRLEMN